MFLSPLLAPRHPQAERRTFEMQQLEHRKEVLQTRLELQAEVHICDCPFSHRCPFQQRGGLAGAWIWLSIQRSDVLTARVGRFGVAPQGRSSDGTSIHLWCWSPWNHPPTICIVLSQPPHFPVQHNPICCTHVGGTQMPNAESAKQRAQRSNDCIYQLMMRTCRSDDRCRMLMWTYV